MNSGKLVENILMELEMSLLKSSDRKSEIVSQLLAEDFLEFGSSGKVFNKAETMHSLKIESTTQFDASQFRTRMLAPDVALLTYSALRHGDPPLRSLRCSVWEKKEDHWQMVFHQGTAMSQLP